MTYMEVVVICVVVNFVFWVLNVVGGVLLSLWLEFHRQKPRRPADRLRVATTPHAEKPL